MISEEKTADLHELVRLYQQRDKVQLKYDIEKEKERDHAAKAEYSLAGLHQDNACDIESNLMELDERIDELLTKHDLKV